MERIASGEGAVTRLAPYPSVVWEDVINSRCTESNRCQVFSSLGRRSAMQIDISFSTPTWMRSQFSDRVTENSDPPPAMPEKAGDRQN